jgi:uncharacterized protein (DUF934 family)
MSARSALVRTSDVALWRTGGFADDIWTSVADGESVPATGAIIVTSRRWRAEREALTQRADPVGVSISPGKEAEDDLREAVDRPLVALDFPKFADGRAFSLAQLLRQRLGFRGELRAIGEVLLDEIPLMIRCGFDSFEIANEPTLRALKSGRLPGGPLYYQPSLAAHEIPAGTRPWLRRAAIQARLEREVAREPKAPSMRWDEFKKEMTEEHDASIDARIDSWRA